MNVGAVGRAKDAHRDPRWRAWFDGFLYDLRLTLRSLRRDWTLTYPGGHRHADARHRVERHRVYGQRRDAV
jgi:hypothetical protein